MDERTGFQLERCIHPRASIYQDSVRSTAGVPFLSFRDDLLVDRTSAEGREYNGWVTGVLSVSTPSYCHRKGLVINHSSLGVWDGEM